MLHPSPAPSDPLSDHDVPNDSGASPAAHPDVRIDFAREVGGELGQPAEHPGNGRLAAAFHHATSKTRPSMPPAPHGTSLFHFLRAVDHLRWARDCLRAAQNGTGDVDFKISARLYADLITDDLALITPELRKEALRYQAMREEAVTTTTPTSACC